MELARQTPTSIDNTSNLMPPTPCACAVCDEQVPLGGGIMRPLKLQGHGIGGSYAATTHAIMHLGCWDGVL
jgi:hypothetical protein